MSKIQFDYREIVSRYIEEKNATNFNVITNFGNKKTSIGAVYPDIIMYAKNDNNNDTPIFIIEIKKNGDIAPCLQKWSLQPINSVLYIIVPEFEVETAKSIANTIGISVRFGSYTLDENNNVTQVLYNV